MRDRMSVTALDWSVTLNDLERRNDLRVANLRTICALVEILVL